MITAPSGAEAHRAEPLAPVASMSESAPPAASTQPPLRPDRVVAMEPRRAAEPPAVVATARPAAPLPAGPVPAAAPPVIEIHIGSIEVRAAPLPAAPAAPPAPTSTSLDAFLAQGRGG